MTCDEFKNRIKTLDEIIFADDIGFIIKKIFKQRLSY